MRRKRAQPLGRQSRSQSPQGRRRPSRAPQQIYIKTTPAIPANANIHHILVNVAKTEGPFDNPQEAVKAAIMALHDDAWYSIHDVIHTFSIFLFTSGQQKSREC